jgi:aryl-alcohol dehydrogenase-like predicted oxidoreductase
MIKKKIILGTAQFNKSYGNFFTKKKFTFEHSMKIKKLLIYANKKKINSFETAILYKNKIDFFKKVQGSANILTKLPKIPLSNKNIEKWMIDKVVCELKFLNKKSFWAILFHNSEFLKSSSRPKILSAINYLKKKNYCKKVGVSIYEKDEIQNHLKYWKPDIIELPYNVFDQRISEKFLRNLKKNKISLFARSIFLQGLLISDKTPKYFKPWRKEIEKWDLWCKDNNISKINAALNFIFNKPYFDKAIIGFENKEQLKEILDQYEKKNKLNFPNLNIKSKNFLNPYLWKI